MGASVFAGAHEKTGKTAPAGYQFGGA